MNWNPLDDLTPEQRDLLDRYEEELSRVNRQVNLVSPSTIAAFRTTHVLHSLAIARKEFPDGATVVDFGSGGGLPAVPLAIRFPDVRFVAVDSSRKKTEAVRLFARRLELENVDVWNGRAEEWPGEAHYAASRATAPLVDLWRWFKPALVEFSNVPEGSWQPGLLAFKGGDLHAETADLMTSFPELAIERFALDTWLREVFKDKVLLHIVPTA